MKILIRWNDKITYAIILIAILASFVLSIALWIWIFDDHSAFWNEVVKCSYNQDFNCLLLAIAKQQSTLDNIKVFISFNLSIVSLFLSTICVTIYKFKFEKK